MTCVVVTMDTGIHHCIHHFMMMLSNFFFQSLHLYNRLVTTPQYYMKLITFLLWISRVLLKTQCACLIAFRFITSMITYNATDKGWGIVYVFWWPILQISYCNDTCIWWSWEHYNYSRLEYQLKIVIHNQIQSSPPSLAVRRLWSKPFT